MDHDPSLSISSALVGVRDRGGRVGWKAPGRFLAPGDLSGDDGTEDVLEPRDLGGGGCFLVGLFLSSSVMKTMEYLAIGIKRV